MVATAALAPAKFKTYQDRKHMSDSEEPIQSIEQFKLDKEMHRLIRRLGGPEVYSIYTHLVDCASKKNEYGCWPTYESIMEDLGILNRAVVAEALHWLFDAGLIEWGLEGRKSWFIPLRKADSSVIELLNGSPSFRNRTINRSDRELSIVLIENANVNQSNVNQTNDMELISNEINGDVSPSSENELATNQENIPEHQNAAIGPEKQTAPPLDKQGPLLHRYKTAYLAVGNAPANHNKRCGVIGEVWQEITGRPPNYPFIAKVMREDCNGRGWPIIEAILGMANKDITEDPEGYLRRILQNGQQRRPDMGRDSGNQQLEPRASRIPTQSRPNRPLKPVGSGRGGRFTEAELNAGYDD